MSLALSERARRAGWRLERDGAVRVFDAGFERSWPGRPSWRHLIAGTGPDELYRAWPGLEVARSGGRQPVAARAPRVRRRGLDELDTFLARNPETPRLDPSATPRADVRIKAGAVRAIRSELREFEPFAIDGFETGGWTFGRNLSNGRSFGTVGTIDVEVATGLGDGESREGRVGLDDELRELERHRLRGVHRWVGAWHLHPSIGEGWPSEQDRRASLRDLDRERAALALELIVTPSRLHADSAMRSFLRPVFTAWVTYRTRSGEALTVPARIVEIASA